MKVRAYESTTIQNMGIPVIEGYTLGDWKALLVKGIQRNVREGRNLNDWDVYENEKDWTGLNRWVKVEAQPDHEVDESLITFHVYSHGGRLELQAVYFFDVDNSAERQ